MNNTPEIFISYGWGGESETTVDKIYDVFKKKGYNIIRDKIDLGYKGNIKAFMKRIGKGKIIVVVISDKYLKSENCMYEMLHIYQNNNLWERVFPIVLSDANIYDPISHIDYITFWEKKIDELNQKIKTISNFSGIGGIIEKTDQYRDIRRIIDEIIAILRDMNTLTPEMHEKSGYNELIKAIDEKINRDYE